MKTKFFAVMLVTITEFSRIVELANRVIAKLKEHIADFASPVPTVTAFELEVDKLESLNGEAKGNTLKKAERDAQAIVVFNMMLELIVYVNGIAKGNKVLVLKSGFDADKEPQPAGAPAAPVIRSMKD